MTGWLI